MLTRWSVEPEEERRDIRMELAFHAAASWGRNPEATDGGFTAAEAIRPVFL
jgi:hypothetical protein